jgi:hypothetical protein
MVEQTFRAGDDVFAAAESPNGLFGAVFEDDGETGYFYAVDLVRNFDILDAVQIYIVANVVGRDRPSGLLIVWSEDGRKCALLINDYPHAVFDFEARRGYCRSNFPNYPDPPEPSESIWPSSDHSWSDEAAAWLYC